MASTLDVLDGVHAWLLPLHFVVSRDPIFARRPYRPRPAESPDIETGELLEGKIDWCIVVVVPEELGRSQRLRRKQRMAVASCWHMRHQ
jgi:hypothetical protein